MAMQLTTAIEKGGETSRAGALSEGAVVVAGRFGWWAAGMGLFLVIWTLGSIAMNNPVLLPSPLAVGQGFLGLIADHTLAGDVLASLRRVFTGFLAASCVAVPLALLMASFRILRLLMLPIVTFLRPIPPIAWIPIAILWFGIGDPPSYFITAVAAFFPIFINAFSGGTSVLKEHINAAQCLGAGRRAMILRILLPSALPMITTGLRIGLGQSWMAVVTSELIAAQSGLGYMIQINRLNLETANVLVGMVVIGLLGSIMSLALEVIEQRYLVAWRYQQ